MKKFYNSIYAYDFSDDTWHYDCKYILRNGNWYYNLVESWKNKIAMPLDKYHIQSMEKIIAENKDDFKDANAIQW